MTINDSNNVDVIKRPLFKVKSDIKEEDGEDDRLYHRQAGGRSVKTGDVVVLIDILTVCGTTLYTLMLHDDPSISITMETTDEPESYYIAEFYESELEATGNHVSVPIPWLENQRKLLLN